MQPTDFLAQTGGLQAMARELGVSESQAAAGAAALLPAVLGGFKKRRPSLLTLTGLAVCSDGWGAGRCSTMWFRRNPRTLAAETRCSGRSSVTRK